MSTETGVTRASVCNELVLQVLRGICIRAQWAVDASTPVPVSLERAAAATRLVIAHADDIEVDISLRLDPALVVAAKLSRSWTDEVRDAFRRRLEDDRGNPLVRLALLHAGEIGCVCARSAAAWEVTRTATPEQLVIQL